MKTILYIETLIDLEKLDHFKISTEDVECIVSCKDISRFSKNSINDLNLLISLLKKKKYFVVIEWDLLEQQNLFLETITKLKEINLFDVDAIRVQDPGAVEYVLENYPFLKIQLILENGNHNLVGLKRWCSYVGSRLSRIVVSNELSKDHLKKYSESLSVPLEVLVFGRILLFYSPRKLMSPLIDNKNEYIEAFGTSEESPHSGFPLIENEHGTFMFNVKDLYLLDHIKDLESMNINYVRVDLRFDGSQKHLNEIYNICSKNIEDHHYRIKDNPVRPFIKGFYNINKSDVLFKKLKNFRTQRRDEKYLGEVIDVEKDSQIAILIKSKLQLKTSEIKLKLVTPEGKEKNIIPQWIKDSSFEDLETVKKDHVVLIPYISGITVKTQVYFL